MLRLLQGWVQAVGTPVNASTCGGSAGAQLYDLAPATPVAQSTE